MEKKEFQKSEKFSLNDSIEYANDGIVSKTVLNKETGTVTIFAFDKGQGLSEHTAPFDAMISILDGNAEIFIDGNKSSLVAGESIIMPANIPHAVNAVEKFKMCLIMIRS